MLQSVSWLDSAARYAGAAFLLGYGAISFYSAFNKSHSLNPADENPQQSFTRVVLICLGFTWLNPHVYLDTLVLMGSISSQYPDHLMEFSTGAVSASIVFFFSLGYGASFLRPVFNKPYSWKVLEALIGIVMWSIAISLLV